MTKIRAAITGVHGYVPDYILTNQELETMVDTNDEWITTRTGIKERRILKGEGLASSDLGVGAIKGLLKKENQSRGNRLYHMCYCYSRHDFSFNSMYYCG